MKISNHFTRKEFACKCGCGFATVDVKLVELLEVVRSHFGKPVIINSGCRCPNYNNKVGGASKSKHMEGIAADIVVKGVDPAEVHKFITGHVGEHWAGIGKYNTFTHIDSRPSPARWEQA
ncbi:peptidase M15 [Vibrio phage 1.184.A._10N.286.49.A5]|nr:peptidase M15 [Vibrio phage 1.184.A._10N.286.49.A5]